MQPLETLIEERFIRASGPGGQNVNKVSSAVQLRYAVTGDSRISPAHLMRLRDLAGQRLSKDDVLIIDAKEHRSQEQNRHAARLRLATLLTQACWLPKRRRPTKPSRRARQRRLDGKATRSRLKQTRRRPNADD
ncbi:MAG: alternative ribosome rescue aminoacyl-tRNA hydrolase ArfB [Pseudomonadota bacterium]